MKVAQNEKQKKKLVGFAFYVNIGFEAFLWNLNLSANRLIWRCGLFDLSDLTFKARFI